MTPADDTNAIGEAMEQFRKRSDSQTKKDSDCMAYISVFVVFIQLLAGLC